MKQKEADFWVLEYVTITKNPRTDQVVAIGGTEKADILQRAGGFLSAPGPRGDYHRLPHGLPVEQQRLKATAASHALLAAGHSIHLDLLERLGLERHAYPTDAPLYIWHTVAEHLDADEQRRLATRAIPSLLVAGYEVNCTPDVFNEHAYQQAVQDLRSRARRPAARQPAPSTSPSPPTPGRRMP